MNEFYMDLCHSQPLAQFRYTLHQQLGRTNLTMTKVAFVQAAEVQGTPTAAGIIVNVAINGGDNDTWLVTAQK
jgi:hypothetical protein